jgi:hypothetical protein
LPFIRCGGGNFGCRRFFVRKKFAWLQRVSTFLFFLPFREKNLKMSVVRAKLWVWQKTKR